MTSQSTSFAAASTSSRSPDEFTPSPSAPPALSSSFSSVGYANAGGGGAGTAGNSNAGAPPPPNKPLKRGSACQICRKRKLRCSGDRPVCSHCSKNALDCVYDVPGKPKSRVASLESKIAELEGYLASGSLPTGHSVTFLAQSGRQRSNGSFPYPSAAASTSSSHSGAGTGGHHVDAQSHRQGDQEAFSSALWDLFGEYGAGPENGGRTSGLGGLLNVPGLAGFGTSPPRERSFFGAPLLTQGIPGFMPSLASSSASSSAPSSNQEPTTTTVGPPPLVFSPSAFGMDTTAPISAAEAITAAGGAPSGDPYFFLPPDELSLIGQLSTEAEDALSGGTRGSSDKPYSVWAVSSTLSPTSNGPASVAAGGLPDPYFSRQASYLPPPLSNDRLPAPQQQAKEYDYIPQTPEAWGDGTQLPHGLREHLLKQFFLRRRQFGIVLSVERFLSSLDGPPKERPHPALLFSMYCCCCRFSPDANIRSLEPTFNALAKLHIDQSIPMADRMVQVVQACVMMTVYLYSRSRLAEGWAISGLGMRIAVACQLHRIHTSDFDTFSYPPTYRPPLQPLSAHGRTPVWLPPPKDRVDLRDRIWAFWSIFLMDRISSASTGSPVALTDSEIITPWPNRPLEAGTDLNSAYDSHSISDLFSMDPIPPERAPDSLGSLVLKALCLFCHASRLFDHVSQPSLRNAASQMSREGAPAPYAYIPQGAARSSSPSEVSTFGTATTRSRQNSHHSSPDSPAISAPTLNAFTTTTTAATTASFSSTVGDASFSAAPPQPVLEIPPECKSLHRALLRFIAALPAQYRDASRQVVGGIPPWHADKDLPGDQGSFDGNPNMKVGINPVVFSVHSLVFAAFALLYEEEARFDASRWPLAIEAAKSVVDLIRCVVDIDFGQLDTFISVAWRLTAPVLIREAKRLRREGDDVAASATETEAEVLVLALKRIGEVFDIGFMQAEMLESLAKMDINGDGGQEWLSNCT